jgi:hypothetical protein
MDRQRHENGGLLNETHREKAGTAEQSTHGRMGLGTACEKEISRMKKISIDGSEEKNVFGLRKTAFTEKFL